MNALETLVSHGNPSLALKVSVSPPSSGRRSSFLRSPAAGSLLRRRGVGGYPGLRVRHPIRRPSLPLGPLIPRATASHEGSDPADIDVDKVKSEIEKQAEETEEQWRKTVESLKEHAVKMQGMSQEAYEVYSKKAILVIKDVSEKLKVQAEKARQDMALIAEEASVEGKEYLSYAVENSPEPVKEIMETYTSEGAELKEISEVRDFFVGIPYGALLFTGGFLSFMLTGSVAAIRFGMILGGALLALSIVSLRAWKEGKHTGSFLKGQAGIAGVLFLRDIRLLSQRPSFWVAVMALISGSMVAFYLYRIKVEVHNKGSEN